jgi:superfamily II DNA or RNA helicase
MDSGEEKHFAPDSAAISRVPLGVGSNVSRAGIFGVVVQQVDGQASPTWQVAFADGTNSNVPEGGLRPAILKEPMARLKALQLDEARDFNLRSVTADYLTAHRHNALVSLGHSRVDLKPHQVSVVHRVISKYPHRFLLADEVGLGKTIEAAMIIKELRARKQARRVLILVPPGLTRQWQFELKSKFNETFAIYDSDVLKYLRQKGLSNPWSDSESVIVSHTWASWSEARRSQIAEVDWDMIIVDEAHHARRHKDGKQTNLFKLVRDLVAKPEFSRRAVLFLTATPLQLDRSELYSLLDMLDPVLFASEEDFRNHVLSLAGLNKTVERLMRAGVPASDIERESLLEEVAHLLETDAPQVEKILESGGIDELVPLLRDRHRLSEVMIRNRKSVVGGFQPRRATRWEVDLSDREAKIHDMMNAVLERGFRLAAETNQNAVGFLMVTFEKLLASSSRALLTSLKKRRDRSSKGPEIFSPEGFEQALLDDQGVSDLVAQIPSEASKNVDFDELIQELERVDLDAKTRVLVDQLSALFAQEADAKVLIFTEFRETQKTLEEALGEKWTVHLFHGQLKPDQKDNAVHGFKIGVGPQVLVSTEAGGEGRNFQFCHYLVNYDLPWNPMKVEQRIGRLDRIGQSEPVSIFNFHVKGTIEGRILDVLERRIRVFEDAVGGLDPILGEAERDITKALRLVEEDRLRELEAVGRRLEEGIKQARQADEKLRDFILQDKSYGAGIAQVLLQAESPISQSDFEKFMCELLRSAHTWIDSPKTEGDRRVVFHAPFTIEHPEVIGGVEARRVCFDPRIQFDSEQIEYFGFGHPIVDALVHRVLEEKPQGLAAVRSSSGSHLERAGWQFNWMIKIEGLSGKEILYPVFVDDDCSADDTIGQTLLELSRSFGLETCADQPPLEGLEAAYQRALVSVGERQDAELAVLAREAAEMADTALERTRAVFNYRMNAAKDRIEVCRRTLEKLERASDPQQRRVIPVWEANLARAEGELDVIVDDREKALLEIQAARHPTASFSLLNVARIQPSAVGPDHE